MMVFPPRTESLFFRAYVSAICAKRAKGEVNDEDFTR